MQSALANAASAALMRGAGGEAADQSSRLFTNARSSQSYAAESTIVEEEEMHGAHATCAQTALSFFQSRAVQDPEKTPPFEVRA